MLWRDLLEAVKVFRCLSHSFIVLMEMELNNLIKFSLEDITFTFFPLTRVRLCFVSEQRILLMLYSDHYKARPIV